MILLDTNVVSESMRVEPDARLIDWMDRQCASHLFLSAISVDEIIFGIETLPNGRRKKRLVRTFAGVADAFVGRIADFDANAARESARYRAHRRLIGRPMSLADSQIAGTAKSNGLSLATLNPRDFQAIDLSVVEPY
ncbi:MAG: type II toxin-antitoxin system VapC family toxin [Gammaproteobacteria bacterium]|nr:type II toxin-antitoxin system VapC family toxin [Gammaproteobacteria bacterium]